MEITEEPSFEQPSLGAQLWLWLRIGAQSFGGGAATLYLIRQAVVERHKWVSDQEFSRMWSICQIAPGINLLAITILLGWHVGGALGVAVGMFGLMLPSVSITIALTAAYASIQGLAVVQAALRGVVSATIGVSVLLALGIGRPPLEDSRRDGTASIALSVAVVLLGAVLVGWAHVPVVAVLFGSGIVYALTHWLGITRRPQP